MAVLQVASLVILAPLSRDDHLFDLLGVLLHITEVLTTMAKSVNRPIAKQIFWPWRTVQDRYSFSYLW